MIRGRLRYLWPAAIDGLGARQVIAFTPCRDCAAAGGARVCWAPDVGDRITHSYIPGTWIAYGALPLCLRHALERHQAVLD